jgi:hypothetical protein
LGATVFPPYDTKPTTAGAAENLRGKKFKTKQPIVAISLFEAHTGGRLHCALIWVYLSVLFIPFPSISVRH